MSRGWIGPATTLGAAIAIVGCSPAPGGYSATVQTESISVGSLIGGRVSEVDVQVGSVVQRGAVIVRLDPALLEAESDEARGQAGEAAARVAELEAGNVATDVDRAREQSADALAQYHQVLAQIGPEIAAQAAAVRDAEAVLNLAQSNLQRTAALVRTGDVARQDLDRAQADDDQARAHVAAARATYVELLKAQLPGQRASARANARAQAANYQTIRNGARSEDIAQARAAWAAAEAETAYDRSRLDEMVVRAPANGTVAGFNLHPGDLLAPDQQAAIIDTFADPYVYIYALQRDLARLRTGVHVRVVSDAGGAAYDAVVEAHDRTPQFTPQNVETVDQRADLVYGVKLRIRDPRHELLSGTTVTVSLR